MDAQRWKRISAVFDEIVEVGASEQSALLDRLCGDDISLRRDVEALLAADFVAREFDVDLDSARGVAAAQWIASTERFSAGRELRIGPWRVLRELGTGGMGVVLLGERADAQFEQRAAIKLIKRGMDSNAVQARFLRERQILARLEHSHIARLLDGGIADDGRPYFAMEYVDGEPLLRHCADKSIKLEERIRLFLQICAAVQFAHGQLVVHRDIKPSNVLIAANGEAKLLDFGIAKLLDDSDSGANATLDAMHRPLTPAYAAPEQLRGEPVTTATDIYSLGAVLYELLTGKRPLALSESPTLDEVLRAQDTTDPAAPSRIVGDAFAISSRRLRGDLDTIVLKTLHREPSRRYGTVAELADDLQRFLSGLPIIARRDQAWYRVNKFVGRHRIGVCIAAIGFFVLLVSFAIALSQAREKAREAQVSQEVTHFLIGLFNGADPALSRGATPTAQDLLDQGTERLRSDSRMETNVRARLLHTVATTYLALGLYDRALSLAKESLQLRRDDVSRNQADIAESLDQVGRIYRLQGNYAQAEPTLQESLAIRRASFKPDDASVIESVDDLGLLEGNRGKFDAANALFGEALASAEHRYGSGDIQTAPYVDDLAANLDDLGRRPQALEAYRRALAIRENRLGPDDAEVATSLVHLGVHLDDEGQSAEASKALERAVAIRRKIYGPDHPMVGFARLALAGVQISLNNLDEAERESESTLAIFRRALPADHPKISETLNMLAIIRAMRRDFAGAIPIGREAVERMSKELGPNHPDTLTAKNNLSYALLHAGQFAEAEQLQRAVLSEASADNGQSTLDVDCENLMSTLVQEGKFAEAKTYAQRAVDFARRHGGDETRQTAIALRLLALAEEMDGDKTGAERDYRGALQIQQKILATSREATTHEWKIALADLLISEKRCDEAMPLLDGAIADIDGTHGTADPRWKPQARLLGAQCIAAKNPAEARSIADESRTVLRAMQGVEIDLYPMARSLLYAGAHDAP